MNGSGKSLFILVGFLFLLLAVLQACSSDPPVIAAKGSILSTGPTYTPTPCGGVFGNNVAEASFTAINDIWYNPFTTGCYSQRLSKLSVYTASSGSVTYELGIYTDNGGAPATLMTETGSQVIGPATIWSTVPTFSTVLLSQGVTYWLAVHSTVAAYAASTQTYGYQSAGAFGTLPSPATATVVPSSFTFSIYGTYP